MINWISKLKFKVISAPILSGVLFLVNLCANDFVTLDELLDEDTGAATLKVKDPLEPVNRVIFKFNDFIYLKLFEPVASTYAAITPDAAEVRLSNFFENLNYPVRLAGNLMQGKFENAVLESGAFFMNTTVGLAGLHRPSDRFTKMESLPKEDIGQALGAWGLGNGPYLVLPILGPSTCRELAGWYADRTVHPLQKSKAQVDEEKILTAYTVGKTLVESPLLIQRYKQTKRTAFDPYIAVRNAYLQYREGALGD